jgi:putative PIN family toxin of toxin-antitoxin system
VRIVIDTNVLVSGLLWHGAPHALIERVRDGTLSLITSPALLGELAEVVARPKFLPVLERSATSPDRILAELRQLAELIDPPPLPEPVSRDPDDDVLALAIAAQADLVVSGDDDLLTLGQHAGIPILSPTAAMARLGE